MAYDLSPKAEVLSQQTNIQQQIILEIEGIPFIFGAVPIQEYVRIGEAFIGEEIVGGVRNAENSRDLIDIEKTSNSIKQQIEISNTSSGSVSKFVVTLVDKDQELTRLFQPGNLISDILTAKCDAYLGFQGGAHPEDSIRIFAGSIDDVEFGAGNVKLSIANPQQKLRSEVLQQITTKLDGAIDDVTTTINLVSTEGLVIPTDTLRSFVRIDDEVIEYTDISGNTLLGVVRGVDSVASSHENEIDVVTVYRLDGNPLDISLKLALSGGEKVFATESAVNFVQVDPSNNIANSFLIEDSNIQDELGLSIGDLVTITGASNASNNVVDAPIIAFTQVSTGTAITLDGVSLVQETASSAEAQFVSQYNVLNDGAAMTPREVDVERFIFYKNLLAAQLPQLSIPITDTVIPRDFLSEQALFIAGYYQTPRKGRWSISATIPPISLGATPSLTEDNVLNPSRISPKRSLNDNFYNAVAYRYNKDIISDKLTAFRGTLSARSTNQIKTGTKTLKIDADGLQDTPATDQFLSIQSRRFIDRFQFAAETIMVEVNYKTGFNIEVGDTVFFGSKGLQVTDITNGSRNFSPRLFEVTNKTLQFGEGNASVKLRLTDTKFGADGRVGVVSPSSFLAAGSTTSELVIRASYSNKIDIQERQKWEDFLGQKILVHSPDYSYQEEVLISDFPASNPQIIEITPPLSSAPPEGYLINIPYYPDTTDKTENAVYKDQFVFFNPQVSATGGTTTTIEVSLADADKFFVGAFIRVHSDDFTRDSNTTGIDDELEITDITGTTLTVNQDIGFTVLSGDKIDLIGFSDLGDPYRVF